MYDAGVSDELKTFFSDVVRPRASPKIPRPRSQSDKLRSSKVMSLTDTDMAGGQYLRLLYHLSSWTWGNLSRLFIYLLLFWFLN